MYHDVLLSQQMIPAIKPDTGDTIIFQQDNVPATAPVRPRSCCNSRPTTSLLLMCGHQHSRLEPGRLQDLGVM